MSATQLIAVLVAVLALFLGVGWALLRNFISELRATRDVVSRGQGAWDAAADTVAGIDRTVALLDQRVRTLESHDFQRLREEVALSAARMARVESDVKAIGGRIEDLVTAEAETNALVKELRGRRRADRGLDDKED